MGFKAVAILLALGLSTPLPASETSAAAQANNEFGIALFKATAKRTAQGNKFLSPISAFLALSMAYNGTEGQTQAEMERALAVTGLTRTQVNHANRELIAALTTDRDFELRIANSLWAKQGFVMKGDFVATVRSNYGAAVEVLDFRLASSADTINDWVKEQTKNKIVGVVRHPLPPGLRLLLINATYFEADWTAPFDSGLSRDADFSRDNGSTVQVPTMHGSSRWKHIETEAYEAIELPYGEAADAAMVVIVPKSDLVAFESNLAGEVWENLVSELEAVPPRLGTLALPSLEIEYQSSLVGSLQQMGMRQAFTSNAELGALTDDPVSISDVLQKTYVKVFEKGTIAAAVTGIGFGSTSVPNYEYHMKVDRPYAFGIRDKRSGALLFFGTVQEPEGGKLPPSS